jgi:hypothetical protein
VVLRSGASVPSSTSGWTLAWRAGGQGCRLLPKRLGKNWDRWRPGRFGNGRGVPGLLWGDVLGQSLVRALGDVDLVEPVNHFLQLPVAECQRLIVQSRKGGPVEELAFSLRAWLVWFAGDRIDPERSHVGDKPVFDPAGEVLSARPLPSRVSVAPRGLRCPSAPRTRPLRWFRRRPRARRSRDGNDHPAAGRSRTAAHRRAGIR